MTNPTPTPFSPRVLPSEEQLTNERRCYGTTIADLTYQYERAAERGSPDIYVMSILSDAQEVLHFGGADGPETARQWMNKAKYLIGRYGTFSAEPTDPRRAR